MRVLIGTLHCGENEFDRCVHALESQRHDRWDHFVLENLPEKEAHERLYDRFMASARQFDLFLKLDADMVLSDPDKLGAAVEIFERDRDLDHVVFRVHDWMTDSGIIGIHMYRNRVQWPKHDVHLFTDQPPVLTGHRRYVLRRAPSPLALHSPDPSPIQAFHFGLHRGLKAFQIGLNRPHRLQALLHWRLLKRLWRHFDESRDERLGLALLAVGHVVDQGVSADDCNYGSAALADELGQYESLSADEMHERLRRRWASSPRREAWWMGCVARRGRAAA